ncbi:MAG: hypothetical protein B6U97_01705 [Candidatus Altiarchaeales archaeon ex4484_96]|nr:MAG: hypothetical protein B6U97_01705 [Candidatus Altiarchaeales archaeon ex4484_96]
MTCKKIFLLTIYAFIFLLLAGCTTYPLQSTMGAPKSYTQKSAGSPELKIELLDTLDIPIVNLSSQNDLEKLIHSKYNWVYTREGIKDKIKENSTFVLRLHIKYSIDKNESLVSGARIKVSYIDKVIGLIKPLSDEYRLMDSYHQKGIKSPLMSVNLFRYGSYGELKRGEEQEIVLVGYTRKLDYLEEAVTRIYFSLTLYRDDLINESMSIRIVS